MAAVEAQFEDDVDLSGEVAVIDVLFVYSGGTAREWNSRLGDHVRRMVADASAYMLNSGTNARLRLAGLVRGPRAFDRWEEDHESLRLSPPIDEALAWVGENDDAARLRDEYGADLVYALIREEFLFVGTCFVAAGIPSSLSDMARTSAGVFNSWRQINCMHGNSLAHQVGHSLGLVHDWALGYPGEPMTPGGRGFSGWDPFGKRSYGTIMSVFFKDASKRFSTSKATENGRVIGVTGEHEASAAFRFAAPYAAALKRPKRVTSIEYGCPEGAEHVCMTDGRFRVSARFTLPGGEEGRALIRNGDIGGGMAVFYFFAPDNPEMLIKVVDGCALNEHYWVFGSAATDLDYEVEVVDQASATVQTYARNRSDPLISDTAAFPCGEPSAIAGWDEDEATPALGGVEAAAVSSELDGGERVFSCYESAWQDCMEDGRFEVLASFGPNGSAQVRDAYLGDNAVLFYFYSWDNPELLVKVVDGCALNGHYWVFGSAATDRRYGVTVRDRKTVLENEYSRDSANPLIADTVAFPC